MSVPQTFLTNQAFFRQLIEMLRAANDSGAVRLTMKMTQLTPLHKVRRMIDQGRADELPPMVLVVRAVYKRKKVRTTVDRTHVSSFTIELQRIMKSCLKLEKKRKNRGNRGRGPSSQ